MTKKIISYCDIIMEICWLFALVSVPIYFNIYTSRVFEPDKISLLRSLVMVALVAWSVKGLAFLAADREEARLAAGRRAKAGETTPGVVFYPPDGEISEPDSRPFLQRFFKRPLVPFAMALSFVYILATILSIVPGVSWWGSYQRLEGTYTFLSYVSLFLLIAFNMRTRRQVERSISFVLLANIPIGLYGILQHNKIDPLPWQGDVVVRVTSTMGNAIFISAYLIMVIPLAYYRLVTTGTWLFQNRAQGAKYFKGRQRDLALSWVSLYGTFIIFLTGLFFVVLNLNANYRPASNTAVASSLPSLLESEGPSARSRSLIGNESIGPWWALPLGIMVGFGIFFLFTVKRQGTDNNYLFRLFEFGGYLALLGVIIMTTLYSQSRGPLAGIIVATFLFFPIVFWRRKMWRTLGAWMGIGLLSASLLVLYNLPIGSTPLEPAFNVARQNPQLRRLGEFFETDDGTGKVRLLIWRTVLEVYTSAATEEPYRLLIGYGPEALYNKSPQHYQPELGQFEARNAIPDRSHNGYLDALATTGAVGLLEYLAYVGAFLFTAFKLLWRTQKYEYQMLLAALIAIMIGHQIEIQTGIQIATSWMMFWFCSGLLVVMAGLIYGKFELIGQKTVRASAADGSVEPVAEPEMSGTLKTAAVAAKGTANPANAKEKAAKEMVAASTKPTAQVENNLNAKNNGKGKAGNVASATNSGKDAPVVAASAAKKTGGTKVTTGLKPRNAPVMANAFTEPANRPDARVKGWFWAALAGVVAFGIWFTAIGNLFPIMADTVYKQGYNLAQGGQWQRATPFIQQSIEYAPSEDFYRLYSGQAYLELALQQFRDLRTANAATPDKAKEALVLQLVNASERELLKATQIAPLNPDHYANLARLYTRWADIEPARSKELLQRAVNRYQEVTTNYSPRNPRLWAELASVLAGYASNRITQEGVAVTPDRTALDSAVSAAAKSVELDGKFDFNRSVYGDILRFAGKPNEAGVQYLALADINIRGLGADDRYYLRMQALGTSNQVDYNKVLQVFDPEKKKDGEPLKLEDRSFAILNRGIVNYYRGDLDKAAADLQQSASLTPADAYAHAYLALVYKRRGQTAQAQTEASQARDIVSQGKNNDGLKAVLERLLAT